MKWLRFKHLNQEFYGFTDGETVKAVNRQPWLDDCFETGQSFHLTEVTLLAPCSPTKIVGVGLNYRDHALEMKMELPSEPILFLKPPSALLAPHGDILLPEGAGRVDYEAELAVVIGRTARNVSFDDACAYVFGYTCGNDVTARHLQKTDQQWTRAKSFDTFCPLGPWIVSGIDPSDLEITLEVNGVRKQHSRTSQLVCGVAGLVAFISRVMTLNPGDIILTGTPAGVGPLHKGDLVTVSIDGIGVLTNSVT